MFPLIISSDEVKKKLKGYNPKKAEQFHGESAKIADKDFARALQVTPMHEVILMSGGSASGKTEFISEYLTNFEGIIVDSTLPTIEGAKIKIKKILKAGKKPRICAILPDDLKRAFTAFLNRERKFKEEHFYRTHSTSRTTLLWIAQTYNIPIHIFESFYQKEKGKLIFQETVFDSREEQIEFLKRSQYTQDDIIKITQKR